MAKLFYVYHRCCSTEFAARSEERCEEMHRDYHNYQYDKGRRTDRI